MLRAHVMPHMLHLRMPCSIPSQRRNNPHRHSIAQQATQGQQEDECYGNETTHEGMISAKQGSSLIKRGINNPKRI